MGAHHARHDRRSATSVDTRFSWERRPPGLPDRSAPVRWTYRGYLPHLHVPASTQAITFCLADAIPPPERDALDRQLAELAPEARRAHRRRALEKLLDEGRGTRWLARDDLAELVERALLFFDGDRYVLHAWAVMPTHCHVVLTPSAGISSSDILHSWKGFSAREANRILGRTGPFWQRESFDRVIRDERHFEAACRYAEENPVTAGLCREAWQWRWSSAWWRHEGSAEDGQAWRPALPGRALLDAGER